MTKLPVEAHAIKPTISKQTFNSPGEGPEGEAIPGVAMFDGETIQHESLIGKIDAEELDRVWDGGTTNDYTVTLMGIAGDDYDIPEFEERTDSLPNSSDFALGNVKLLSHKSFPATHPTTGRLVSVSLCSYAQGMYHPRVMTWPTQAVDSDHADHMERELIKLVLNSLEGARARSVPLFSFNGKGFDLWFIRARMAILGGLSTSLKWSDVLYPWSEWKHCDARVMLGGGIRSRGTLELWTGAMGIESEESGAICQGWYNEGKFDEFDRYGFQEMRTLAAMWERVHHLR